MFTGLVEDLGQVVAVTPQAAQAVELRIRTRLCHGDELPLGASLAVDGCCLTVTGRWPGAGGGGGEVTLVAAFETLRKTTLGERRPGDRVNLEAALRLGDRLGGHLVTGHVDGVGRLLARTPHGDALEVRYGLPRELARFVVEKGSICVDGVSLTVNRVGDDWFEVGLIPHTLTVTTLDRPVGSRVNVETDLLGKYVARLLGATGARDRGWELLRAAGFWEPGQQGGPEE